MNIDRAVMAFVGIMVLLSLALAQVHHTAWLFVTALLGAHLFQMAFTGFCPMAKLLKKIGIKSGQTFQ